MEFERVARAILGNIEKVLDGKPEAAEAALVVFLAEGHLLIEDVPGVGKTVLAKALGRSVSCSVRRIQFTPDLLPSDITGVSVYDQAEREFEFKPGAVFANIVIGDEINRASPKTQSALLEAMEERQVTVDGTTYVLASPFSVVATQNPFEMEGTYALPEAQRDRFMARISMGYPDASAELAMVRGRDADNPFDTLAPVASVEDITAMIAAARAIHVSASVEQYVVDIAQATRVDAELRLGASPRATLQLIRAAKARAAVQGRDFVLPDDVDALVPVVLPHRLIPMRGVASVEDVVARIVAETPVPAGAVQPG
ncbi:MAG: ATPase [Aeromicrobium sp.]|jgi:MoxR-like ATPase|nr:ATPase [Aeromicrobium sp.]